MSFLINSYAFLAAGGDFEPIATVTVGSGGATYITFSSIPSTYQHLQVRVMGKSLGTTYPADNMQVRFNADYGTNYASHGLNGNGSTAGAIGRTGSGAELIHATGRNGNVGACVIDVLDYANTSKNTTIRCFGGADANGSGVVAISSLLWISTSAVTSIRLDPNGNSWAEHSTAALYGVKA